MLTHAAQFRCWNAYFMSASRIILVFAIVVVQTGCIGYRAASGKYDPGYLEVKSQPGVYRVTYNGPGNSSFSSLEKNLNRRANELCGNKYTVTNLIKDWQPMLDGPSYNYVSAIVSCGAT